MQRGTNKKALWNAQQKGRHQKVPSQTDAIVDLRKRVRAWYPANGLPPTV